MAIDRNAAAHIANVVRRQIQDRTPDFSPVFILQEAEDKKNAVEREARLILKHPAGEKMMAFLRAGSGRSVEDKRTKFIGLADYAQKYPLGFFDQHKILAVFLIHLPHFSSEFDLRSELYHLVWHALALREDYLRKESRLPKLLDRPNFFQEETYESKDGIIRPKLSAGKMFQRNLMADVFAACVQVLDGDPTAIRGVAAYRLRQTLAAREGFIAERYPYAVCHDTLEFMFENDEMISHNKKQSVRQALKIAQEIGHYYAIPATEHWKSFSQPAQHMAWVGAPAEVTLGAAIYSSDNPYVRAIADIVVDFTRLEPEIITTMDEFNPFIAREKAMRGHHKMCMDALRRTLLDLSMHTDASCFALEARKQDLRLRVGNPLGWCGYALLRVMDVLKEEMRGPIDAQMTQHIQTIYEQALAEIPYDTLLKFSVLVFQRCRLQGRITDAEILKLAGLSPDFARIGAALQRGVGLDLPSYAAIAAPVQPLGEEKLPEPA